MTRLIQTLVLAVLLPVAASGAVKLQFDKDGRFKIAQFTDLHWNDGSPLSDSTARMIRHVLAAEKPDLAVVTGDVVTYPPARAAWARVASLFEEAGVPWSVTLGNHDDESGMGRREIFEFLGSRPMFVGASAPGVSGWGNHTLEIAGRSGGRPAALIYLLDTHNKPPANKLGDYDWVHFDQVEWYRGTSRGYTAGAPLPALMFLHIPLQEYGAVARGGAYAGNSGGGPAASEVNSGLFASLVDMQDVMGVFAGHDHGNDYIGKHMDIALAYGRVGGYNASGRLARGARVVVLREGEFAFDTWIATPNGRETEYFFPSGITAEEESTMEYLPATEIEVVGQGVDYTYYEGRGARLRRTSDIERAHEAGRGVMPSISVDGAAAADSMAYVFTTWIRIPQRGVYNFYTFSDDGSTLSIDGRTVVDNDGGHSLRRRDGRVGLDAGFHLLEVRYFEDYMGQGLEVGYSGRNVRETALPGHVLFRGRRLK